MVKNIKRYKKELEKENNILGIKDEAQIQAMFDFLPTTYVFPGEYSLFVVGWFKLPNMGNRKSSIATRI
jgi:tubulin polyglutamylase TTLL1